MTLKQFGVKIQNLNTSGATWHPAKKVVLIYKDNTHKYVNLPNRTTKKYKSILKEFEEDTNIIAILSSNLSQDAYEQYLYPKAKSKSVDYVIQHYNTYFKPILPGDKLRIPL